MMRRILIMGAFLGLACSTAAQGHSWYPSECCSMRDCTPADGVETDARGDFQVIVGRQRIWVPKGFEIRPSKDDRVHICFRLEVDLKFLMPLCLFMPPQS